MGDVVPRQWNKRGEPIRERRLSAMARLPIAANADMLMYSRAELPELPAPGLVIDV